MLLEEIFQVASTAAKGPRSWEPGSDAELIEDRYHWGVFHQMEERGTLMTQYELETGKGSWAIANDVA